MNTEPTEAHTIEACKVLKYDWASYAGNHLNSDEDRCIRTVARYIANQQPAIAPELVKAAFALVRDMANIKPTELFSPFFARAEKLNAELDASKPDPLLIEARDIVNNHKVWGSFNQREDAIEMVATALKRGMELERSK